MKQLTIEDIQRIFKRSNLDKGFSSELIRLMDLFAVQFKVDTDIRRVRFLAQVISETGVMRSGVVRVRENLNYSYNQLTRVSRYFRNNKQLAKRHARSKTHKADQRAIANIMYADKNRSRNLRLGNVKEGDGFLYRGVGIFQSTGRENVTKDIRHLENITGAILTDLRGNPYKDVLDNYTISILLGLSHWHRTGMWKLNSTTAITNKINRGLPQYMKKERVATAYHVLEVLA